MAKISKETAEKELICENMSDSKSNKKSSKARTITLKVPSSLEEKNDSNSKKRKIKNIKHKEEETVKDIKKVELQKNTPVNVIENSSSNSKTKKSRKRTLHLNLSDVKKEALIDTTDIKKEVSINTTDLPKEVIEVTPSISHVIDTSVNQNSPFFYEPSVFERFNINITNISDEELQVTSDINETDINKNLENNLDAENSSNIENIDTNKNLENISNDDFLNLNDLFDKDIEISPKEVNTISENIEQQTSENNIIEKTTKEELLDNNIENNKIEEFQENENNAIKENEVEKNLEHTVENLLESDYTVKEELSKTNIPEKALNTIEKFFDSSIPSITSNKETSQISKIKKSIFAGISPIFKKFTFEEATLANSEENSFQEIVSNVINTPVNEIISTMDSPISTENFNQNTNLEISAKSVTNISDVKVDTNIINSSNNSEINTNYEQIITPELHSSNSISSMDDDLLIDELINNSDFLDEEFENNEDTLLENYDIDLDDVNIDDFENNKILENNKKENYNDDTFSIEAYFGLDKLNDDDFEYDIKDNTENNTEVEENSKLEPEKIQDNFSPEKFEEKFFEENSYIPENNTSDKSGNIDSNEIIETNNSEDITSAETNETNNSEDITSTETTETNNSEDIISNETTEINNSENIISTETDETNNYEDNTSIEVVNKNNNIQETIGNPELLNFTKLIENFNQTISTLSERIANLEAENSKLIEEQEKNRIEANNSIVNNNISDNKVNNNSDNITDIVNDNSSSNTTIDNIADDNSTSNTGINDNFEADIVNNDTSDEIEIDNIEIEDLDINLEDLEISNNNTINIINDEQQENTSSTDITTDSEPEKSVEDILSDAFLSEEFDFDDELLSEVLIESQTEQEINKVSKDDNKQENEIPKDILDNELEENLLEDMLLENIYQEDLQKVNQNNETTTISEITNSQDTPESDFLTIIDSLSKTISDLENSSDIKNRSVENSNFSDTNGKSINILIDKDDIFSISILNETYEIVADFDGISVLSENIHISTPKNNFFVEVGEKYIEIHKQKGQFVVNTNFEDVEFANAINNVTFAKKNNKIELNIKEAFKLSSGNNKVELSMLNTSIADISSSQTSENIDENSICDNRTLLISEETQKVYLPYTIEEIMRKLNNNDEYQTAKEVIENEYTLPLSTFKMPVIARFKEAYRFMRIKEKSSIYAAVDLGLELMFNSELNPAIIRACKDLKELNIYLDCLYENEVDKFDCFKIVYKVLPKIQ